MENQKEIWKDVLDYEGVYQVSNLGRVKSLKFGKERILSANVDTNGYLSVSLCLNGNEKTKTIHKLIAQAFLGKSNLDVNHKNLNKIDNNLFNLEYVSERDNTIHSKKSNKKTSNYTGVSWHKSVNKWRATIKINGKIQHLGYFESELKAHESYLRCLDENNIKSKYANN